MKRDYSTPVKFLGRERKICVAGSHAAAKNCVGYVDGCDAVSVGCKNLIGIHCQRGKK